MRILVAILCGFLLDLLLGDPARIPHPVVWMGKAITALEHSLRAHFPQTPQGERKGGVILAVFIPVMTLVICGGICCLADLIHPSVGFLVQVIWCWQALALRGLATESRNVYEQLTKEDLLTARKAVSRIVGRDTDTLTAEGVIKAAVETVAENFSDGVVAPLFFMLLGGAPLAMVYKSINTMDSMVGYKNDRYFYFGCAAAKLDDVANYLPSRLAALFWIISAFLTGYNGKRAWKIWRRDRRNHASPNSAQTESACAGALDIQLAGPAFYFGKQYLKPTIGDPLRTVEPEDILRANRMMYVAGLLVLLVGSLLRGLVWAWLQF